jgi:hypothetical protein
MNKTELREALAVAGSKFDGHVTNGSLDEQMKVIATFLDNLFWGSSSTDFDSPWVKYVKHCGEV